MHQTNTVFNRLLPVMFMVIFMTGALALGGCKTISGAFPSSTAADTSFETQNQDITTAPQGPPVKVALLVPLTGKHAALGQGLLNAAQMALFDVGFDNFELMPRDTGGTPQGAATAAQQVINDGAQIILGPLLADEVRAVKPAARNANINVIAFSTSHDLADNNTFVMGFLPFDQVERVVNFAAARGVKRVGLLSPSSDYGRTVTNAYQSAAARAGITTAQALSLQPEAPSPDAVRRLAAGSTGFDAIFMPFGGGSAVSIASQLIAGGLPPGALRLGTGLLDDAALATRTEMDGFVFAAPAQSSRTAFEQRYAQTYGNAPPRLSTLAYDATALTIVLSQKGSPGSVFSRSAIGNPNGFAGLDGIFRFRANGLAERGLAVQGFRGGRIETIDPAPTTFQSLVN